MDDARHRELLLEGPQLTMADVERLKDYEPQYSTIYGSILLAYPTTVMSKRQARRFKSALQIHSEG